MNKTGIPYVDFTWNPGCGCPLPIASEGCARCWARSLHNMRHKAYLAGKQLPIQYAKPFEEIQLFPDRLDEPLRRKEPCSIAVCFMGDLFAYPFEFIDKVFNMMVCKADQHIYQVLTKRPERMAEYIERTRIDWEIMWCGLYPNWPFKNIWLGVTCENQEQYNKRWSILSGMQAAVKFVSHEPLLQDIEVIHGVDMLPDWAIIGCESGLRRRPCSLDWVRNIASKYQSCGVPVFIKQLDINGRVSKKMSEWPKELQVQEYPKKGSD